MVAALLGASGPVAAQDGAVLINEVDYEGELTYVELMNTTSSPVDLAGQGFGDP